MRARLVILVCIAAVAAGCTGGGGEDAPSEVDYYGTMRGIDAFADATDAELDDLADSACGLVAAAVDAGDTNAEAVDRVFAEAQRLGLTDAEALLASVTIVGANCPLDITK